MKQATKYSLKDDFLDRAKSLADLPEVYRSSQVTLLLAEALAVGYRLEAEVFQAAYGDSDGREYWKALLSELIPIYKLAHVLSVHAGENVDRQDLAKIATVFAFRDAAEAGEDWFIGDAAPLLALKNGQRRFESLGVKVHPRTAVAWLLSKPKRVHLVPQSLQRFFQFDQTSIKERRLNHKSAEHFVDNYINDEQGQGRRPTVKGLDAAAKAAGVRGGRQLLRAAFNRRTGGKQGRPAKTPTKSAKK